MTCSSSRTWAYMSINIPCSPGNSKGGAGWRNCHSWFCAVLQARHAIGSPSVRSSSFISLVKSRSSLSERIPIVKFPASRTWVWSTSMQPLALVVLGIPELPQPVHLASTRITQVKIVLSQVELLTGYSRCNMAYPAKRTFRRKQKLLRRKWRCNRLRSK